MLFVGIIALAFIFKHRLEELKYISYVFLTMLGLFITLMFMELARDSGIKKPSY